MQCCEHTLTVFVTNVGELTVRLISHRAFLPLSQMALQAQLHFLCENIETLSVNDLADITANLLFCRNPHIARIEITILDTHTASFHKGYNKEHVDFETQLFGRVDILFEESQFGVYLLNIAPGKSIPDHLHLEMEEHELILDSGLYLYNKPVEIGNAFSWPKGVIHGYENRTDKMATVLCIDTPKFIPSDEIMIKGNDNLFTLQDCVGGKGT
ncbi:hypothetical protein L1286_15050 [Pseudoalteromonas sp. SMS1]|uniref:cupin domain-containing protein n=1 Tax=Pseudoalteromonas sp. SMS1 TaxID=2908894 RepID=UPI001F35E8D9|nr:hypothetical protein [Pseudoalteromonas sp. SMS1]MCF2858802.1 hypothetical protein [Pseudoalteromonas sp. SMS1]